MKAPPPRPELCGSTRPSTACTATAASSAEPPARSTFSPALAASGLAAVTIACGVITGAEACRSSAAGGVAGAAAGGWANAGAATAASAMRAASVRFIETLLRRLRAHHSRVRGVDNKPSRL